MTNGTLAVPAPRAPRPTHRLAAGLLALGLGLLSACESRITPLTEQEKLHMVSLTEHMTPRCIGRFLIDLPRSFVPNPVQLVVIEGVEMEVWPMPKAQFQNMLQRRTTELANAKLLVEPYYPMLHETHQIDEENAVGSVFDRAESDAGSGGRFSRTLELRAWKSGYAITASIKARDTRFPEDANDSVAKQLKTDTPEKLAHLLSIFKRIHGRADTEVPDGQGVCLPNAVVRGPASDEEHLDISYRLNGAPDVSFEFHSLSNIREKTDLLERGSAIESSLKSKHGYTLRKGHVNGQLKSAQEWLIGYKPPGELAYQSFTLEANSKTGFAMTPVIVLDFGGGERIPERARSADEKIARGPLLKATLNESEILAVWDTVVPTLRPRPGAL